MRKKWIIYSMIIILVIIIFFILSCFFQQNKEFEESEDMSEININEVKEIEENSLSEEVNDNEILGKYYEKAYQELQKLTLDEKIGQIFLVRYPKQNQIEILKKYHLGGYLLFEDDFSNKTENEVKEEIQELQETSKIDLLIAVDEEGGSVVRVSSNPNLSAEVFRSPSELYQQGGLEKIKQDTIKKSEVLRNLGINLNLAPVVDVCTNSNDYMYNRSLKEDTKLTSEYAKTVIETSKNTGVSYTLKHFPGYGNNLDTHEGASIDKRSYEDILKNDLPPFKSGIDAGAEAVLVSHNIVTSIDEENPASLSKKVHELLRNDLKFKGVIITDNLDMGAVTSEEKCIEKAILAGNDILIITDYESSIQEVKDLLKKGKISMDDIDRMVFNILAWKYAKGLI